MRQATERSCEDSEEEEASRVSRAADDELATSRKRRRRRRRRKILPKVVILLAIPSTNRGPHRSLPAARADSLYRVFDAVERLTENRLQCQNGESAAAANLSVRPFF